MVIQLEKKPPWLLQEEEDMIGLIMSVVLMVLYICKQFSKMGFHHPPAGFSYFLFSYAHFRAISKR